MKLLTHMCVMLAILLPGSCFACPCQPHGAITSQYPDANATLSHLQTVYFGQEGWTEVTAGGTGESWTFVSISAISQGSQVVSWFQYGDPRTCGATRASYLAFSSWDYEPGSFSIPADMATTSALLATKGSERRALSQVGPDHWTLL